MSGTHDPAADPQPRGSPVPLRQDTVPLAPHLPFPSYAFVPGETPHPRTSPSGHSFGAPMPAPGLVPERWREDPSYLHGIDLYHAGYLWEAHEAFEAGFFAAADRPSHRRLLQALVQLAAAVLQARRGVGRGVRFLARGAAAKLRAASAGAGPGARIAGLDPAALLADVERHFASALDAGVPEADAARTAGPPPRLDVRDDAAPRVPVPGPACAPIPGGSP